MFVSEIKDRIKQKVHDFYKSNEATVDRLLRNSSFCHAFYERDTNGEKIEYYRPNSSFILGVACSGDPEITELIELLGSVNSNLDSVVSALGLNEDPEILLKKKREKEEKENSQQAQLLSSVTPSNDVSQQYQ